MKLLLNSLLLCFIVYQTATTVEGGWSQLPSLTHSFLPRIHSPSSSSSTPLPTHAYHHMQFVQSWPPTYCRDMDCIPTKLQFYTHGLWPADSSGNSLKNCQGLDKTMTSEQFRDKFNDKERAVFAKTWRSINSNSENVDFWSHQWREHGVCSSSILDPKTYFSRGASIGGSVNLLAMLNKANIFPGHDQKYTRNEIKTAIEKGLGGGIKIKISCLTEENPKKVFLREVYICMDPSANHYVNCPAHSDGCGPSRNNIIYFPSQVIKSRQ